MKPFTVVTPRTLLEALEQLADPRAAPLAGGTDLLGLLKDQLHDEPPHTLVNLKALPELGGITVEEDGALLLGALATLTQIAQHTGIADRFPLLTQAAHSVGSRQLRNMGTLGGNLCQEVRCWYYRYPKTLGGPLLCARKGGKGCPAVGGDHRNHSIFGGEGCFAVSPSDLATALVALDATFTLEAAGKRRQVLAEEFHTPLGSVLRQGELLTSVRVPPLPEQTTQRYLKFTLRHPIDFALAAVACVITTDRGQVTDARLALGGVAPTPLRAMETENQLIGKTLDPGAALEAAALALKNARPLRGNGHRVKILSALVERALGGEEHVRSEEWGEAECEESSGGRIYRWNAEGHNCTLEGAV